MIKINTLNELSSENIEVVIFTMPMCGPCKIMKPSLQMAVEGMDDVTLYELDAEANIEVARELNVASTPTTIFFKNGEVDIERSIKYAANKDGALRMRIQGTSTAFEFRKNNRYDGRGKDNNDLRLYVFHWSKAAYEAAGSQNPSDGWVGWDSTTGTWNKTEARRT